MVVIRELLKRAWDYLCFGYHCEVYLDSYIRGIISFEEYLEWEKKGRKIYNVK